MRFNLKFYHNFSVKVLVVASVRLRAIFHFEMPPLAACQEINRLPLINYCLFGKRNIIECIGLFFQGLSIWDYG